MLKGDALLSHSAQVSISNRIENFGVGDTIIVQVKVKEGEKERLQAFKGVVMAIDGKGANRTFTVRKISANNVGVERIFLFNSPSIESVTRVAKGKVRRAKLYYLRKLSGRKARIQQDYWTGDASMQGQPVDQATQPPESPN